MDAKTQQDFNEMLIDLQHKEIERLKEDADNVRRCVYAIFKILGTDRWAYNLEAYEKLLHDLLIEKNAKTDYRCRTRDVEVKYLKDHFESDNSQ